ncbi:MAG: TPR end-of-group domain-containing protein [Gaiellaceae bacterium]
MTDQGYEVLSLDDLDRVPYRGSGEVLRPLRQRLGFRPFGVNVWSADAPGDKLIPPHDEDSGHEELYVVVRGAARFTVGNETFDAPAGTLIHVESGTFRAATSAEGATIILVAGAKEGEAFVPGGWEDVHIAFALLDAGDAAAGRAVLEARPVPEEYLWGRHYNLACYDAMAGETDAALEQLRIAVELDRDEVMKWLPHDTDLDPVRDDPRFAEIAG